MSHQKHNLETVESKLKLQISNVTKEEKIRENQRKEIALRRDEMMERGANVTEEIMDYLTWAIPFWALGATTLKNATVLCVLILLATWPASYFHYMMKRQNDTSEAVLVPITVIIATALAGGIAYGLLQWDPSYFNSLRMLFFLVAAGPCLLLVEKGIAPQNDKVYWASTGKTVGIFIAVCAMNGAVRELLSTATLWGHQVFSGNHLWSGANAPFFGLILSSFSIVLIRFIGSIIRNGIHIRREAERMARISEDEEMESDIAEEESINLMEEEDRP